MKWWNRLSYRLTFFILLIAVVPLTSFGIATLKDIKHVRLKSEEKLHESALKNAVSRIESYLTETADKIRLVIESSELEGLDTFDQEWQMQIMIKDIQYLHSISILDLKGTETVKVCRERLYQKNDLITRSDLPDFTSDQENMPFWGNLVRLKNNRLVLNLYLLLLSPVERHIRGILNAEIDVEKMLSFISDMRIGDTGYLYLVDDQGKILIHPDRSVVLAGKDARHNPLVKAFVSGSNVFPVNQRFEDLKGIISLTNGQLVENPRFLVVAVHSEEEITAAVSRIITRQSSILAVTLAVALSLSLMFTLKFNRTMRLLEAGARRIGSGEFNHRVKLTSSNELGSLANSFNAMAGELQRIKEVNDQQDWIKKGIINLDALLRGKSTLEDVCNGLISFIANYLNAKVGLIYVNNGKGTFQFVKGYAVHSGKTTPEAFQVGQGLPGQAALEKREIRLTDVPENYIRIVSGLGDVSPRFLTIIPLIYNDQVEAVLELGFLNELSELQHRYLEEAGSNMAIVIASARSREALHNALNQTRQQAEELQRQQEELQTANEEMEEQTQMLMVSESKLKEQQEELQAANEELEEKTDYLEQNKRNIEKKNQDLEKLSKALNKKAEDLAIASKYKSEFLANMSHELRTPLNSMLLLSRLIADNKDGNLTDEQVESLKIIFNSGNDLLTLINEILDLSKIEAGRMSLALKEIRLKDIQEFLQKNFQNLAAEKGLSFEISIRDSAPQSIVNDQTRVLQILKNFISNAFKFTDKGSISVEFYQPDDAKEFVRKDLFPKDVVAIDVTDTGIGISEDKQQLIFEAFHQVEGGSSRKYGGTGLGLSISKELASLLGGEIHLKSKENEGSTFTLILPKIRTEDAVFMPVQSQKEAVLISVQSQKEAEHKIPGDTGPIVGKDEKVQSLGAVSSEDDWDNIESDGKTLLIIEDDYAFAKTLATFCRDKGFKTMVAQTGEEGLKLVETYPFKAIILDIHLPGIDGWTVLESLKENPATRHIPVHFMSADDPDPEAFSKGAVGFITKPVSQDDLEKVITELESMIGKTRKDLLLVEDDQVQRKAIINLISGSDVSIQEVVTGKEAILALSKHPYDCMILDLGLPDMSGFDLLKKIKKDQRFKPPPVLIYTARDLTAAEEIELRNYSDSIIIKGIRSEERLLDETSLFLHRIVDTMPHEKKKMISNLHDLDKTFQGKTILIVDDDMRNVFALSKVLASKGVNTIKAENGFKALQLLDNTEKVDLVLMDIMMPGMDGYETMKRIRANDKFRRLAIIALTAKAMQRDKDDCIAAGANDYLAKPVQMDRLFSMMRVWLYDKR